MADSTEITWAGEMAFDVALEGHASKIDAAAQFGGRDYGPKPKSLVLVSLAGCTGMDVVSILGKMRMPFDSLKIKVDGELSDEHPKVYKKIHITYAFTGNELDREKIEKAATLSQTKYCGVAAMLRHSAEITWGLDLAPGKA